jgi:hypothetical protein
LDRGIVRGEGWLGAETEAGFKVQRIHNE